MVPTALWASWALSRGPGTLGALSGSLSQRRWLLSFQTHQAAGSFPSSCWWLCEHFCAPPSAPTPGRLAGQLLGDGGQKKGRPQEASSYPFYSISFHTHRLHPALCCREGGTGCTQVSPTRSALGGAQRAQDSDHDLRGAFSPAPGGSRPGHWEVSDARVFGRAGPSLHCHLAGPGGLVPCHHDGRGGRGSEGCSAPSPHTQACALPLPRLSCWGLSVAPQAEAPVPPPASHDAAGSVLLAAFPTRRPPLRGSL